MSKSCYGLALHTTTPELGLALSNFAGESRVQVLSLGRSMAATLQIHLSEFLKPQQWTDLAFIAVACGPGGFTGTRLGVVTARTLAQQLQIPLFSVSTLAALAVVEADKLQGKMDVNATPIAVEMKAQRGQVFGAIYQLDNPCDRSVKGWQLEFPHAWVADRVFSPEDWQQELKRWPNIHHIYAEIYAETYTETYAEREGESSIAHAVGGVLQIAHHHWQTNQRPHWTAALPFYGQHPVNG